MTEKLTDVKRIEAYVIALHECVNAIAAIRQGALNEIDFGAKLDPQWVLDITGGKIAIASDAMKN